MAGYAQRQGPKRTTSIENTGFGKVLPCEEERYRNFDILERRTWEKWPEIYLYLSDAIVQQSTLLRRPLLSDILVLSPDAIGFEAMEAPWRHSLNIQVVCSARAVIVAKLTSLEE